MREMENAISVLTVSLHGPLRSAGFVTLPLAVKAVLKPVPVTLMPALVQ